MSGATDSGMVKTMGIVMAAVAVIAVVCVLAARLLGGGTDDLNDPLMRDALMNRIQPIAAVRTSADELETPVETAMVGGTVAKSGEELVNGACAACHLAGVAGAPALDDDEAWAARRESGLDALVASVINGKGAMPARGGSAYSDEEIRIATQYMAGFDVEEAEAVPAAQTETTPSEETEPEADAGDSAGATDSAATSSDADSAEAPTDESSEDMADAAVTEDASETVAALVVGQVPDGLTDNIKASVDGVCAGCHLAGVAGAPMNGDTAAWQERADKGLEALTASVINGLNVMPPRGGSTLTDEEIPIAIQYLMSK